MNVTFAQDKLESDLGFSGAVILAIGSVLATRVAHDPAVERARRPSDRFSRRPRVAAPERVRPVV